MDELDALLGDLGKGLSGAGTARASTALGRGAPATTTPRTNPQAPAAAAARPAPRPTSGLDDLDALVASLGTSSAPSPVANAARSPLTAASQPPAASARKPPVAVSTAPAPAQSTDVDDIDALMASLSLPPSSAAKPATTVQSQPRTSMPSAAPARTAAPVAASGGDGLLDDIDAIMASLGPAPASAAARPAASPATMRAAPAMNTAPVHTAHPGSPTLSGMGRGAPLPQPQPQAQPQTRAPAVGSTPPIGLPAAQTPKGTCATCQRPIQGPMMQALGGTYHPNCFICGSCGEGLGTGTFYQSDGRPTCARCYQAQFCARCAHCSQPVQGSCISAINKQWHVNCFICAQCLKPFGTSPYFERDGNPFCEGCFYGIFSSRCGGCDQPIKSDTVNACGRQWHPECFVCAHCRRAFAGQPYFEYGGRPYCQLHYHSQSGSTCGCGCGRPILGRVIQALGRQWLPEHFLCGFCMNSLAGQNFTQRDGKAYCNGCFGKIFAS